MDKALFSEDELNKLAEVEAEMVGVRKRKRRVRKLHWTERQWGAGFMCGLWCGIGAGFVLAPIVAYFCKVYMDYLFAS